MCHDVTSDGLLGVNSVGHATTWVRSHLISDEYGDVELLGDFLQPTHYSVQDLLPLSKLTTATVVNSKGRHDTIDNKKRETIFNHASCRLLEKSDQTVNCEGSTYHDVVENTLRVKVIPVRDRFDALRSESILRVDVKNSALTATLRPWQLGSDAESVTKLGLASPELPESLRDRHTFYTALQKCVKLG